MLVILDSDFLFLLFLSSFDNIFLSGLWKKVMSKRTNRPGISTTNRGRGRSRRGGYYRGMGSGYYPYAPRPRPRYRWGIMHWMASFTFHIQLLILQFLLIIYQISLNLIFVFKFLLPLLFMLIKTFFCVNFIQSYSLVFFSFSSFVIWKHVLVKWVTLFEVEFV